MNHKHNLKSRVIDVEVRRSLGHAEEFGELSEKEWMKFKDTEHDRMSRVPINQSNLLTVCSNCSQARRTIG